MLSICEYEKLIIDVILRNGPMYSRDLVQEVERYPGIKVGSVTEIVLRLVVKGILKRDDDWKVVVP